MDKHPRAWIGLLGASILWMMMACSLAGEAQPQPTSEPSVPPATIAIEASPTVSEPPTLEPTPEPTMEATNTAGPVLIAHKPKAKSSNENGECGTGGLGPDGNYDCKVVMSDGLPLQFVVLKDGNPIGENDGVKDVLFQVKRNGDLIYKNDEKHAAYCLFGGNAPCNSWTLEDGVYKWESGGAVVEAGKYAISIDGTVKIDSDPNDNVTMHWDAKLTITLP